MSRDPHIKKLQADWYIRNKKYMNARRVAYDIQLKYETLCLYSYKAKEGIWPPTTDSMPTCDCCGESNFNLLTLEHEFGAKDEKYSDIRYRGGTTLHRELKRLNFPSGFCVLCFNCNHAYGHYDGRCPHQDDIELSSQHWNTKFKALKILGERCKCCGENNPIFLSVDHIKGGGNKCRQIYGDTYRAIVKNKVKLSSLQILCMNCNCGKKDGDSCPHEIKDWVKWIKEKTNVVAKGMPTGEDNPAAILTVPKVRKIKSLRKSQGLSGAKLGEMFGVSDVLIYKILNKELWQNVN